MRHSTEGINVAQNHDVDITGHLDFMVVLALGCGVTSCNSRVAFFVLVVYCVFQRMNIMNLL